MQTRLLIDGKPMRRRRKTGQIILGLFVGVGLLAFVAFIVERKLAMDEFHRELSRSDTIQQRELEGIRKRGQDRLEAIRNAGRE